jgi:hypothetical protein
MHALVSERGVVFFRKQKDLTVPMQKELIDLLGRLSGKPSTSGLHIHPRLMASETLGLMIKEILMSTSRSSHRS